MHNQLSSLWSVSTKCSNFHPHLLFGLSVLALKLAQLFQRTFKTRGRRALWRLGLVRIGILVILTLCVCPCVRVCVCTRGGRCEEWRRRVKVCCGKSKSPQRPLHCERNSLGEKMDAVFLSPPRCHKLPGHWSMGVWDSREDLALYIYLAQSLQLSPEHKVVSWLPGPVAWIQRWIKTRRGRTEMFWNPGLG